MNDPRLGHDKMRFLAGGGEMGERIRAFDWAKTALGPIDTWPQSLLGPVSMLLPSKAQIVFFWGPDLVTFYNDAYRPVFGAKHPHVLGLPAREAWSEIWDGVLRELFEGVLATGEAYWGADLPFHLRRHGFLEETFFDVSYDPVRDESGEIAGVYCIVTETTARVLGERRLQTLRDLTAGTAGMRSAEAAVMAAADVLGDANPDVPFALFYLLDDDGRRAALAAASGIAPGTKASPGVVDLADAAAAWPFARVASGEPKAEVDALEARFGPLPGGAWPEAPERAVVLPLRRSGEDRLAGFLVAAACPRIPLDEDYAGFLELLAAQVATAAANGRAWELEANRARALAELDRAKTAFFSNVSHEFRTPLTLMLGPVDELLAHGSADLLPGVKDQLELVHRNGQRLLRLVNTLLDFSRIEAGRTRAVYLPTDLARFTAELAGMFRAAIERAGLRLFVDCEPPGEPVYVDRDMWEKIVLNLLSNAFKFTFEGEITVVLRKAGDHVRLEVRDTGTGIAAEEMPRLFERFHRVRNARGRTHEGSGIGLALVQELVRHHGGTIEATSQPGVGTTFTVAIPLGVAHLPAGHVAEDSSPAASGSGASPFVEEAMRWLPDGDPVAADDRDVPAYLEGPPLPASRDDADSNGRPCVLVVDDNSDMRRYLTRVLGERYTVVTAADGAEALAAARDRVPDLVLSDVMMPRLDGFELLAALRAEARTRQVPVILLSARAGEESRVEGIEAGADDYLVKPFSARELLARAGAHIQMARLRRETADAFREADRRKDEFLATLAHELRGPLAPIRNSLEVLKLAEGNEATVRQARATMERQLAQLVRLVDDLLDVNRITSNKLELRPEPLDLQSVVREAVDSVRPMLETFGHAPELKLPDEPIELTADRVRLVQVVQNLLTNAAKYTNRGGHIAVTLERHGDEASIVVQDDGLGIPAEDLARVFDMFVQIDGSLERAQGGLGIGLALVRRLVEMHGGSVEARSGGPGKGSTFEVRLPVPAAIDAPAALLAPIAPARSLNETAP